MVSCDFICLAVLTTKFHPNRISFATLLGFNQLKQFWPMKWFFEKTQKWIGKNHSNFFTELIGIFVIDVIWVSRSSEVQVVISKLKYHHILGFEKLQKKRKKLNHYSIAAGFIWSYSDYCGISYLSVGITVNIPFSMARNNLHLKFTG